MWQRVQYNRVYMLSGTYLTIPEITLPIEKLLGQPIPRLHEEVAAIKANTKAKTTADLICFFMVFFD